jgi:hypothetical protein
MISAYLVSIFYKIETLIDMGAYTLPVWWVVLHQWIELGK